MDNAIISIPCNRKKLEFIIVKQSLASRIGIKSETICPRLIKISYEHIEIGKNQNLST